MYTKRFLYLLFLFTVIFFSTTDSTAADEMAAPTAQSSSRQLDPSDVQSFVDDYAATHMAEAHVPGLAITVVYKGQVILAKGYGYADLELQRLMTAQTNLRAGSVSKPVTSAAVLQLVDRGVVDLNAPISDYLPNLPLQDQFGPASTVSQLLTLKGGYDDSVLLSHVPTLEQWQPLGEYLADALPPRTMPPGLVYSYSSWDHALLGYMLEKVSGDSFDQVIARDLFQPLGMQHTTFSQPLPEPVAANLATGYIYEDGGYQVVPLDYVRLSPGIALVTTAADMSRFMLALLNGGELDGARILNPITTTSLLTRQEEVHPYSRGRTYGFSEISLADRPVLYHDGNGIGFANRIVLAPDHDFGLFLSVNHRPLTHDASNTAAYRFVKELSTAIVEAYIPSTPVAASVLPPLPQAAARAKHYVGHYRLAGTPQDDFFKVGALLDNVNVKDNHDGTLSIGSTRYVEVEPMVFQSQQDPGFFVIFVEDQEQQITLLTFGGTGSYEKASWYETANFQMGLVAFMLLAFLSFLIVKPFKGQRRWLVWTVALLDLLILAGTAAMMCTSDLILFFKTIPVSTQLLFLLPWVSGFLTLLLPVTLWTIWRERTSTWVRLHYSLTTAAAFAFSWFIYYWNLYLI